MLRLKLYRFLYNIEHSSSNYLLFMSPLFFSILLGIHYLVTAPSDIDIIARIATSILLVIVWYLPMLITWIIVLFLLVTLPRPNPRVSRHEYHTKYRYRGRSITIINRYDPYTYDIKYQRSGLIELNICHEDIKQWYAIIHTKRK